MFNGGMISAAIKFERRIILSTIAAIATPDAPGGISVIRISGEDALKTAGRVFKSVSGKTPEDMEGYTCAYGHVIENGENIDDAVLTVFRSPKSYTGEDVAEISCHGGRYITKKILRIILGSGAALAQPGEFTKRAFLNGKLSLTQAEAVMDVISSGSETELRCAGALKEGAVFRRISSLRERLVSVLGDLAAWADFPEEDIPEVRPEALLKSLRELISDFKKTADTYEYGRIIREGIGTVIVGKPNVGKSTLMNLLSGFQRSIVTDIAGTTRDVIEESVRVGELTLRLSDTAGIRETGDVIESMGVDIAYKRLEEADLVLAVFDSTRPLEKEDIELIERVKNKKSIAIINKIDQKKESGERRNHNNRESEFTLYENKNGSGVKLNKNDAPYIYDNFIHVVELSARDGSGLEKLTCILENMFIDKNTEFNNGIIANERQRDCLQRSMNLVNTAIEALERGELLDAVTVLLDSACDYLMELTGEKASEKVIDDVFSRFCVGK